jgi:predicted kinase
MKNPQILILVGPPGSGKSTFSKYFLRTEENWIRVSRDDFRIMQFGINTVTEREENMITEMVNASIEALLRKKSNVLIDATNCKKEYINQFIERYKYNADISFKVFELSKDILEERCENRFNETGKFIPKNVLHKYIQQLNSLKETFDFSTRKKQDKPVITATQNSDLTKAIICDLDGTLALMNGRNPFDASRCDEDLLNEPVANTLKNYHQLGYKIILLSGREEKYKEPTLRFLEMHQIPFDELLMRKTGDNRKDSIIKKEIFMEHVQNKYFIEFILDDRNQVVDMWRNDLQLPCFQVYYGDF